MAFNGSPTRRKPMTDFAIFEDKHGSQDLNRGGRETVQNESPVELTTSKLANRSDIWASSKKPDMAMLSTGRSLDKPSMKEILTHLSQQSETGGKQQRELKTSESEVSPVSLHCFNTSPVESVEANPDGATFATTPKTEAASSGSARASDDEEVRRLREELNAAHSKLAKMDEELAQTRITKHTLEQAMGASPDLSLPMRIPSRDTLESGLREPLSESARANLARTEHWMAQQEDAQSDVTDPLGAAGVPFSNHLWSKPSLGMNLPKPTDHQFPLLLSQQQTMPTPARPWSDRNPAQAMNQPPFVPTLHGQRSMNLRSDKFGDNSFTVSEPSTFGSNQSVRRQNPDANRQFPSFGSAFNSGWGPTPNQFNWNGKIDNSPSMTSFVTDPLQPSYSSAPSYMPRPIGTRLSPTASEFTTGNITQTPWNTGTTTEPATTYVPPVEPLNYRRLLDRNMSCNWKYIVDKIVCNNDQQASIFLQQKLKVGTPEQKYEIVQAIIGQAYSLMVNRFGNFLVQRCFEHGTAEQIIEIAKAIRGNTLNLSMDAFGCHVVQKAFDAVPEEYKAMMVHELLRRIPETVIHRYACHVWQKLFELRWSDSPPQIMKYVNESLRGMWHEVALGETGSLVVQNIFENCLEEDKRPCINEVLVSIDVVAHGQFGNWCIQHICEHGAPADRSRAIDHVLRFATEYSTDQFASKVVEKCLKVGGPTFLERYLERVTEGRPDRPRMPLIDIAGDNFGNYLIQYILTHAGPEHRDIVASHVRKHMVSLRGSKYGSKVAMLCCNPASATRPGPPAGLPLSRGNSYNANGMRGVYGGAYR
ncbi:MAG: hypothetical protein M1822_009987 [Bathelium mastoideum]|nr:MAG: hypothetical protein M1822_009987 [Bathelium mastoideum]